MATRSPPMGSAALPSASAPPPPPAGAGMPEGLDACRFWSRQEVAGLLGISVSTVKRLEAARRRGEANGWPLPARISERRYGYQLGPLLAAVRRNTPDALEHPEAPA